jgi:hypothetical protein
VYIVQFEFDTAKEEALTVFKVIFFDNYMNCVVRYQSAITVKKALQTCIARMMTWGCVMIVMRSNIREAGNLRISTKEFQSAR